MIRVTVRYHNLLRRTTRIAEERIELPESTSVRNALRHLAQRHRSPLREMLFDREGSPSLYLVIFRNRQLLRPEQHDDLLSDDDDLMLFPAVSGG
ncbi:MAG TPA: MoaD/ThiS family protein [Anaerolineae bacterium]|nr:MoaD/ThiS family protein [Anaerolineae bacterium]